MQKIISLLCAVVFVAMLPGCWGCGSCEKKATDVKTTEVVATVEEKSSATPVEEKSAEAAPATAAPAPAAEKAPEAAPAAEKPAA